MATSEAPAIRSESAPTAGSNRPIEWTEFVAETDAAEFLGVSVRTMARWRAEGRIASRRLPGGHVWYHPDDLAALFAPADGAVAEGA